MGGKETLAYTKAYQEKISRISSKVEKRRAPGRKLPTYQEMGAHYGGTAPGASRTAEGDSSKMTQALSSKNPIRELRPGLERTARKTDTAEIPSVPFIKIALRERKKTEVATEEWIPKYYREENRKSEKHPHHGVMQTQYVSPKNR